MSILPWKFRHEGACLSPDVSLESRGKVLVKVVGSGHSAPESLILNEVVGYKPDIMFGLMLKAT